MGITAFQTDAVSPAIVRHALGHFATGVTVVTSLTAGGVPVGTTASAVSSLSLAPPLLLVCLERSSQTLAAIRDSEAFAINVLAEGQEALSANFAQRGSGASWDDVSHRLGATGNPHLDGALAVLDCRLEHCLDGGDHEIVVGRLHAVACAGAARRPLLHYQGSYASVRAA
ncbi:MAG: flavin reductase family protein [Solirubrobacterales bacterium]|nr:flavin reductase family protein [Solirubrobacterales bacterium]